MNRDRPDLRAGQLLDSVPLIALCVVWFLSGICKNIRFGATLLFVELLQAHPASGMRDAFTITELGWPGNYITMDINNRSEVVGYFSSPSPSNPFFTDYTGFYWSAASGLVSIPKTGSRGEARAINNHGVVVGYDTVSTGQRAFFWSYAGSKTLLDQPSVVATDINDSGQIVGEATGAGGNYRAFQWSASAGFYYPPFAESMLVRKIKNNNTGAIIASGDTQGWVWTSATGVTFLRPPTSGRDASAADVSDNGVIGGHGILDVPSPPYGTALTNYAVRWNLQGAVTTVETAGGINDINQTNELVGWEYRLGGLKNALLFQVDGSKLVLNAILPANSGIDLNEARAINDLGQIVVKGTKNGVSKTFLLSPVSPFTKWKTDAAISASVGPDVDTNGDGWPLGLEYALARPVSASKLPGHLPSGVLKADDPVLSQHLVFEFDIPSPARTDVTYLVEGSSDLTTWTSIARKNGTQAWQWLGGGTSLLNEQTAAGRTTVSIGHPDSLANSYRQYMRLHLVFSQ